MFLEIFGRLNLSNVRVNLPCLLDNVSHCAFIAVEEAEIHALVEAYWQEVDNVASFRRRQIETFARASAHAELVRLGCPLPKGSA